MRKLITECKQNVLSKEEKEKIVNERIEQIRKKNELLRKRYEEVQTDKRTFEAQRTTTVDDHEGDRTSDIWKGRGRGRGKPVDKRRDREVGREVNKSVDDAWRTERERIDSERLNRHKTTDGSWKREWDRDKIVRDDKEEKERPRHNGSSDYEASRRPPRNPRIGDYIPRDTDRPIDSRSFYRQRPKADSHIGHDVRGEQANENEDFGDVANQRPKNEGRRRSGASETAGTNREESWETDGGTKAGFQQTRPRDQGNQNRDRRGQPDQSRDRPDRNQRPRRNDEWRKPNSPRNNEKRSPPLKQDPRANNVENLDKEQERSKTSRVDLRAKLDAIRAKKAQEATEGTPSTPQIQYGTPHKTQIDSGLPPTPKYELESESPRTPKFDLKSPARSVEMAAGGSLRVVIPNQRTSSPLETISPDCSLMVEQPTSLMMEGEYIEDDYIHEPIGESFEDRSKSWETCSTEDDYESAGDDENSVPSLEPFKTAGSSTPAENVTPRENAFSPANSSFVSAEEEQEGKSQERNFENVNMLINVSEMMLKSAEAMDCPVLRDGELRALKCLTPGLSFAWGAKTSEEMERLKDFVELPFIYYSTKENYVQDPPVMKKYEMALKLTQFNQACFVEDLSVKLSDDADELNKFCDIIAECFELPVEALHPLPPRYNLLAYQRGVLVGGLIVDIYEQSSIIYFNSVLPKYRGQNISKALMAEAIKLAKEKGAKEMVLYSTPLGEPVYKGLGFKYVREFNGALVTPSGAGKRNDAAETSNSNDQRLGQPCSEPSHDDEGEEEEENSSLVIDNNPDEATSQVEADSHSGHSDKQPDEVEPVKDTMNPVDVNQSEDTVKPVLKGNNDKHEESFVENQEDKGKCSSLIGPEVTSALDNDDMEKKLD